MRSSSHTPSAKSVLSQACIIGACEWSMWVDTNSEWQQLIVSWLVLARLVLLACPPAALPQRAWHSASPEDSAASRAGEMIPEVEGTRPWGPSRKRVPKCSKWPKTTYTTVAIAGKQSKRGKKGLFSLYIGPPRSHPGDGINGARRGRSLPVHPGFSSHGCIAATPWTSFQCADARSTYHPWHYISAPRTAQTAPAWLSSHRLGRCRAGHQSPGV